MDYCNGNVSAIFEGEVKDGGDYLKILIKYFSGFMLIECLISVLLNLILVVIGNTKLAHKTPIIKLSLNLAATDSLASFICGLGILFGSFLPLVFEISIGNCYMLILETFRVSALVASVLHLLALSLLHYHGITHPIQYRLKGFCWSVHSVIYTSILCWLFPLVFFIIYFCSVPCQGFLSSDCDIIFMLSKYYRLSILFAFMLPLMMMLASYIKVFSVLRTRIINTSNTHQIENTSNSISISVQSNEFKDQKMTAIADKMRQRVYDSQAKKESLFHVFRRTKNSIAKHPDLANTSIEYTPEEIGAGIDLDLKKFASQSTSTCSEYTRTSQKNPQKYKKAILTSLFIVGTYILCWGPAIVYYALSCIDGCPYPLLKQSRYNIVIISFVCNDLVIMKSIIDPFIYLFRMKEIKIAIANTFTFKISDQKRNQENSVKLDELNKTSQLY